MKPIFPLDEGYEALKAAIAELRHQLDRIQKVLAMREDHFALEMERAMTEARKPRPIEFSAN